MFSWKSTCLVEKHCLHWCWALICQGCNVGSTLLDIVCSLFPWDFICNLGSIAKDSNLNYTVVKVDGETPRHATPKRWRLVLRGHDFHQHYWELRSPLILLTHPSSRVNKQWICGPDIFLTSLGSTSLYTYIKNNPQYLESPKLNLWNHLSPTLGEKKKQTSKKRSTDFAQLLGKMTLLPPLQKNLLQDHPQRQLQPRSVTSWLSRSLKSDLPTRPPRHGRELHMLTGFCFFRSPPQTTISHMIPVGSPKKDCYFCAVVFCLRAFPLQLSLLKSYKNIQKSLYDQPKLNVRVVYGHNHSKIIIHVYCVLFVSPNMVVTPCLTLPYSPWLQQPILQRTPNSTSRRPKRWWSSGLWPGITKMCGSLVERMGLRTGSFGSIAGTWKTSCC